jgi:hypothetical protein
LSRAATLHRLEQGKLLPMRSSLASWLAGLLLLASGTLLVFVVTPFPQRLVIACVTVFLVDALGGRWFGYFSLLGLAGGLFNDPGGVWLLMLPLVAGSLWAALFLRHAEPGWLGVPLGIVGFALPLGVMLVLKDRLDPGLELPLGTQYSVLHVLTGAFGVIFSTLVSLPLRASQTSSQRPARVKRSPARR